MIKPAEDTPLSAEASSAGICTNMHPHTLTFSLPFSLSLSPFFVLSLSLSLSLSRSLSLSLSFSLSRSLMLMAQAVVELGVQAGIPRGVLGLVTCDRAHVASVGTVRVCALARSVCVRWHGPCVCVRAVLGPSFV